MPAIENLAVSSGNDKLFAFTVNPSDVPDITGCAIRWWLAPSPSAAAVLKKDNIGTGGVTITDGPNRVFTVELLRTDTLDLEGEYYHEASLVDTSGHWHTVTIGIIKFTRTLTTENP